MHLQSGYYILLLMKINHIALLILNELFQLIEFPSFLPIFQSCSVLQPCRSFAIPSKHPLFLNSNKPVKIWFFQIAMGLFLHIYPNELLSIWEKSGCIFFIMSLSQWIVSNLREAIFYSFLHFQYLCRV